jgi:N-acyl-D-amino-acid deacylase
VLDMIHAARASGVDVTFDCYPYVAYSTGLSNLFPIWALDGGTTAFLARLQDPAQRMRIETYVRGKIDQLGNWDAVQVTSVDNPEVSFATGRKLGALAQERGTDPYALLVDIVVRDRNRAGMVGFGMSEQNVERFLAHPLSMICSDAGARATYGALSEGAPHPRAYGAFPRVLGHYCRERKVMPLETAIHKMTGMTAARLKLQDRGRLSPAYIADIVAFDPARVGDTATFEKPHQYATGIPHVIVNGKLVIRDGEHTGALPGQIVKPNGGA